MSYYDLARPIYKAQPMPRPRYGPWLVAPPRRCWAIGLVGAGFLAVPILTGSSAYAIAETFGWKHGLDKRFNNAKEFYGLIALSTLAGTAINFVGINPVKALFWTAVINEFLAPPLLVLILIVSNNPKVMGQRGNGRMLNIACGITAIVMSAAVLGLLATWGH